MDPTPPPRPTLLPLPLRDLCACSQASRPLVGTHADALAADFDLSRFGRPVLHRVGGNLFMLDGLHRVDAYRRQPGVTGATTVLCEVYDDLHAELPADQLAAIFASPRRCPSVAEAGSESSSGGSD